MAQNEQLPIHLTLADLGALYNNASSPNPTPLSNTYKKYYIKIKKLNLFNINII